MACSRSAMNTVQPPDWPSGDCRAVLASKLSLDELHRRRPLQLFRAQDDLDWFTGALLEVPSLGPLLLMRHDVSPEGLMAFYVDALCDVSAAQAYVMDLFCLREGEIAWASALP